MKICHNCGSEMQSKTGRYWLVGRGNNKPNAPIPIDNSQWQECDNCGEQILPAFLCDRIDAAIEALPR